MACSFSGVSREGEGGSQWLYMCESSPIFRLDWPDKVLKLRQNDLGMWEGIRGYNT